MEIFFYFLLGLGVFATIITQSLIENRIAYFIPPFLLFTIPVITLPLLVRVDQDLIRSAWQNISFIQILSLLMISEGILIVWMGMNHIRAHYEEKMPKIFTAVFFLPSSLSLIAVILAVHVVMNKTVGINYLAIVITGGFLAALLSALIPMFISRIIRDWDIRFEMRMLIALIQIAGSSFIPLFINPVSFVGEAAKQSWKTILLFAVFSVLIITTGFFSVLNKSVRKGQSNGNR